MGQCVAAAETKASFRALVIAQLGQCAAAAETKTSFRLPRSSACMIVSFD